MTKCREQSLTIESKDLTNRHQKLTHEILWYCMKYPDAKDTPEGILKWWLPEGQVEWGKEDIQKALDFLTSKGWLTKREATPSRIIYGVNKALVEEIRSSLIKSKSEGD